MRIGDGGRVVALAACALACLATSAPLPPPARPIWAWSLDGEEARGGCVRARAWVSKSGREGVGVTVRVENAGDASCTIALTDARLEVGGVPATRATAFTLVDEQGADAPGPVPAGAVRYAYVGFAFDGATAARAKLGGALTVTIAADGLGVALRAVAHQGMVQPPGVQR